MNEARYQKYGRSDKECNSCKLAVAPAHFIFENKQIREVLEAGAIKICEVFKVEGGEKSVCEGAVTMMADQLLPAIGEGLVSPDRICDEFLHVCKGPKIEELSANAYVKKRLDEKPDKIKNNTFLDDVYKQIADDPSARETLRSIQFSDLHIDFMYQEGAPTECNFPICCRDNGPETYPMNGDKVAGKWGDYECDIPHKTMKNMFEWVANNQDELNIDFITWTGDNSAHNVWDNTQEEITQYTLNITQTLKDALGADS